MKKRSERDRNSMLTQVIVMMVVCDFAPKSPRAQASPLPSEINIPNVPLLHPCPPVLSLGRSGKERRSVHIFLAELLSTARRMCRAECRMSDNVKAREGLSVMACIYIYISLRKCHLPYLYHPTCFVFCFLQCDVDIPPLRRYVPYL